MKKYLLGLLGLLGALLAMFFAKKKDSNLSSDDKVLEYKQEENQKTIEAQEAALEKLKADHDQATKEIENLTPEQVQEYWNKTNPS